MESGVSHVPKRERTEGLFFDDGFERLQGLVILALFESLHASSVCRSTGSWTARKQDKTGESIPGDARIPGRVKGAWLIPSASGSGGG